MISDLRGLQPEGDFDEAAGTTHRAAIPRRVLPLSVRISDAVGLFDFTSRWRNMSLRKDRSLSRLHSRRPLTNFYIPMISPL